MNGPFVLTTAAHSFRRSPFLRHKCIPQASSPVLDALVADSVPTGKRAALYTALHIAYIMSLGLGPAAAAGLFWWKGDEWSTEVSSKV